MLTALCLLLLGMLPAAAQTIEPVSPLPPEASPPAVAIVIDDLGYSNRIGGGFARMPYPLTLAILPDTPYARALATLGHRNGKQIIIHMPMQARGRPAVAPGGLRLDHGPFEIARRLVSAFGDVPYASGISNHEGSRLTESSVSMRLLMTTLRLQRVPLFLDSRTSARSVAATLAQRAGLRVAERDVFLDNSREPTRIHAQLDRLIRVADRRGTALAIGHPHPETLAALADRLPEFEARGIRLLTVDALIEIGNGQHAADTDAKARHGWFSDATD
ncbi:MAG: divergent polysaccharide deacetylase family protein [Gammaproteobacteria bacterium]|nr:divergent polysaccharide deacetylase family protein [Gammaproteobacteria bacterium]